MFFATGESDSSLTFTLRVVAITPPTVVAQYYNIYDTPLDIAINYYSAIPFDLTETWSYLVTYSNGDPLDTSLFTLTITGGNPPLYL